MAKRLQISSQGKLDGLRNDIRWCENRVGSLQALLPEEAARNCLKSRDIPALEKQLVESESRRHAASKRVESVGRFHVMTVMPVIQ